MRRIQKSIEIQAPLETVFEFVTHPENLPSIWPSMVDVKNVQRKADGSQSFDWDYKMVGVRFTGHSETTHVEQNAVVDIKNTGGIPSTFHWTYEGRNGGVRLSCEVEYQIPQSVLGKLAEAVVVKVNEREMETVLANIKAAVEHGVAAKTSATHEASRRH